MSLHGEGKGFPMADDFISRLESELDQADHVSSERIAEIEAELQKRPSADLWILRGDAIQLTDGNEYDLDEAERSYRKAIEIDPESPDAYESLGQFTFAVRAEARRSLWFFRKAIDLGAGESAHSWLRAAVEDLAEDQDADV
jgi:hypothetical protein